MTHDQDKAQSLRPAIATDVAWGAKRGVGIGVIYCVWATAIYAVGGPQAFESQHVTYLTAIGTYLGIGLVSGSVVGALRRFTSSTFGCYLVGLAAGVPLAFGLVTSIHGFPSHWDFGDRAGLPVFSIMAGLVIGNELAKRKVARIGRTD